MGERKVLNKYFPPDFDPKLIPKRVGPKDGQIKVRVMLPFTCQCKSCGEFIHRGKKFNSRCEWADERYLGIRILRFYVKCPNCCQEICFKTDPQNSDYICEQGAIRHFEPWREDDPRLRMMKELADEPMKGDVMRTLETRTEESKKEMDVIDALEEIRELNAKNARVSEESVMDMQYKSEKVKAEEDIEAEVAQTKFAAPAVKPVAEEKAAFNSFAVLDQSARPTVKPPPKRGSALPLVMKKKKKGEDGCKPKRRKTKEPAPSSDNLPSAAPPDKQSSAPLAQDNPSSALPSTQDHVAAKED